MATNNAINSNKPLDVADGGTGATTLTDHGVLVGSGTGAVTALTPGTLGQLLVGATSADPAFASSAEGDFTFNSSTAGTNRTLTVTNTDNTSTSAATLRMTVGGASAGDPKAQFVVTGAQTWTMGIDNNATVPSGDPFVIAASSALGTTNVMEIATTGEINFPLQPAFLGVLETTDSNVTGNGVAFSIGTGNSFTEIFDQNSDFDPSTGVFTAPVTGKYYFSATVLYGGLTASHTTNLLRIVTTSGILLFGMYCSPGAMRDASNQTSVSVDGMVDMTAADTAYISVAVSGSTQVVDIIGNTASTDSVTYYCGFLAC